MLLLFCVVPQQPPTLQISRQGSAGGRGGATPLELTGLHSVKETKGLMGHAQKNGEWKQKRSDMQRKQEINVISKRKAAGHGWNCMKLRLFVFKMMLLWKCPFFHV